MQILSINKITGDITRCDVNYDDNKGNYGIALTSKDKGWVARLPLSVFETFIRMGRMSNGNQELVLV